MADVPMADVPQQADAEGFNAVPSTAAVAEMDVAGTVTDIDLGQPGGAPLTPDPATASTQTSAAGEASTAASADPLSVATPQGSTEPETAFVGQPAQAEAVSAAPEAEAPPTVTAADGHIQASDIAQEAATAAVEAEAPSGTEEVKPEPVPLSPQMEALLAQFAKAKENPADFNGWTALISAADKLADIERVREVYDAFLAEFPLCYGYWKKYADAEARWGTLEHAAHVYERGVASIPYSIDLWGHYAMFKQNQGASHEEMQGLFERSLAYVGSDFLAHGIWDKYIRYESSHEALQNVAALYTRVLQNPIKELARYWKSLEEFAGQHDITALMGTEEQEALRLSLEEQQRAAHEAKSSETTAAPASAPAAVKPEPAAAPEVKSEAEAAEAIKAADPAEDAMQGIETTSEAKPAVEATDAAADAAAGSDPAAPAEAPAEASTAAAAVPNGDIKPEGDIDMADADADVEAPPGEELVPEIVVSVEEIKAAWLSQRQQLYTSSSEELERRRSFEEAIKRPYFHIKPLDAGQLVNWMRYLDYIEQKDDHPSTIRLYERCLVPCASYPEFWARYARYLEKRDLANAQSVVQRATLVHAKRNADTHIFAAHFEERHDRIEEARNALAHVTTTLSPNLLSAAHAHACFEKRQGKKAAAQAVFQKALAREEAAEDNGQYALTMVHYINFMQHAFGEVEQGRAAFAAALESHPTSKTLWEGAICFEQNLHAPDTVSRVLSLYDKATTPPADASSKGLPVPDRELLSQRSVDFAEQHGLIADVTAAETRHAQRFKLPVKVVEAASRKRAAEAAASSAAQPAAKKAAIAAEAPAAAAAAPLTPTSAAAAAAAAAQASAPPAASGAPAAAYSYPPYSYPPQQYPPYYGQYPASSYAYPGY